jgi:hypothetical protein
VDLGDKTLEKTWDFVYSKYLNTQSKGGTEMKLTVFVLVIFFTLSLMVFADEPEAPQPVLKPGDVKHFIKSFPLLKAELKKYEVKYDGKAGIVTYPEAIKASSEFLGILKKHGWDEHFFEKTAAICMGYSSIVSGKALKDADPQIAKSMKEIESNPHLSAEMKKKLLEQMKTVKGAMKQQQKVVKKYAHKADIELIKPHIDELKKVFEEN